MIDQLSKDFFLHEFLSSQVAARSGRVITASPEEYENLKRLCRDVLQPLRDELGPIVVTSGLRPQWLNALIGGSLTSNHMYGCAADVKVLHMQNAHVCHMVKQMELPVDQCILEFPPNGWVHLGVERVGAKRRNSFLTARTLQGKTVYEPGINV